MENINQTLDKAIREKDIQGIRNILTTSMVQDPGFSKGVFKEWLKRCLDGGLAESELFVPFEGEPINNDETAWTQDYYARQRTEFWYNFSRERLEHLKKVGGKHFPPVSVPTSSPQEEVKKKYRDERVYKKTGSGDHGFSKWLIPLGIGAAALLLLRLIFRGK